MALKRLAEDLWILDFPLRTAGIAMGRRTTVIRTGDGRLLLHSTGPFSATDVAEIRSLGEPVALVEASCFHDTFSKHARGAFPGVPYVAPNPKRKWAAGASGFEDLIRNLKGEIDILPVAGIPSAREHLFLHRTSRTMIVCDLLFNLGPPADLWTRFAMSFINDAFGRPSVSRLYRLAIRDKPAFRRCMEEILESWDFDRIIPGHGAFIETEGKSHLRDALQRAGF